MGTMLAASDGEAIAVGMNPWAAEEILPVSRPLLPSVDRILAHLAHVDGARRYANYGDLHNRFQARLTADFSIDARAVLAASGTAALAGAILAVAGRATRRRPVCLVPAHTFIGTLSAIEMCGFAPYLVDVDPLSWTLDARACADHPMISRAGLVVPVAAYGREVEQQPWIAFTQATGVPVAIDGAAAFEAMVARPDRLIGPIPVAVSFHATKSFGVGEGGAVFCSDGSIAASIQQCLNFGYTLERVSRRPAINGKMSEYHAAVGLAELDGWTGKLDRYGRAAQLYRAAAERHGLRIHLAPSLASCYALVEACSAAEAARIIAALTRLRIGCRRWYGGGLHAHPYCARFGRDALPHTDDLTQRLIGIPMAVDLSEQEIGWVADTIAGA